MLLFHDELIGRYMPAPSECVDWVRTCFLSKHEATLPPKISLHPQGSDFFNTMPCLLPAPYKRYGVKVVHRIAGQTPSLGGAIMLYDSATGELLALFDSDRITTMRTGAVAALAAKTFRRWGDVAYGFIGLGNTARATLLCLLHTEPATHHVVYLLKYKQQAEDFQARFANFENVSFRVVQTPEEIVRQADVVFSCLTDAPTLLCEDNSAFRQGQTIIPVHTKGFQNCDLFFDKVFADDRGHVCGFRYFEQFKHFDEIGHVLRGVASGRGGDQERILCYNIGIALHDVYFAHQLYEKLKTLDIPHASLRGAKPKFYI
ncbi:MAG: ornithine cyclodeaminase [Bacteroidaceae bacterium]|nr:ornithine cyclodeaminase [Bacteroidaceae bacterium]